MKELRCIAVDDEILAIRLIETYVRQTEGLQLIAHFTNPLEAASFLEKTPVDLAFIDIQMPQLKGTDLAALIPAQTAVVFVTAYAQFAVESYEIDAVDYLVKPIRLTRFQEAVNKARRRLSTRSANPGTIIRVKSGYDYVALEVDNILYVESMKEYLAFVTAGKKVLCYMTMNRALELLPAESFLRIHRSYIVNKMHVTALKGNRLQLPGIVLPVSRSYLKDVKMIMTG